MCDQIPDDLGQEPHGSLVGPMREKERGELTNGEKMERMAAVIVNQESAISELQAEVANLKQVMFNHVHLDNNTVFVPVGMTSMINPGPRQPMAGSHMREYLGVGKHYMLGML